MLYFFPNLCVFKIMHTRIDVIRHNYDYEEREGGPPPSRSCALGKLRDDNVKSNPRARAPRARARKPKSRTRRTDLKTQPTGRKSPGALVSVVALDASAFTRREEEKPPSLANMVRTTTTTKRNETKRMDARHGAGCARATTSRRVQSAQRMDAMDGRE